MAIEKIWTAREGQIGTAHTGRDGSLKGFQAAEVIITFSGLRLAPKDGVTESITIPAERRVVSVEEEGDWDVTLIELTGTHEGIPVTAKSRQSVKVRNLHAEAPQVSWTEKERATKAAFETWLLERMENPLLGLSDRDIGRLRRGGRSREEAGINVLKAWGKLFPLSLNETLTFAKAAFVTVPEISGGLSLSEIVLAADENRREEKKKAWLSR